MRDEGKTGTGPAATGGRGRCVHTIVPTYHLDEINTSLPVFLLDVMSCGGVHLCRDEILVGVPHLSTTFD